MDQQTMETMAAEIEAESKSAPVEQAPPAAPEAPEPEPAPEQAAPEQPRMVPYQALAEERKHRQATEADYKRLEGRIEQINAWLAGQREPEAKSQPAREPEGPTWEQDPAGYLKYHIDRLNQDKSKFEQHLQSQTEQAKQTEAQQQFLRAYAGQVQSFAAAEPNYVPAFNHWIQARGAQLAAAGLPPELVQRTLVDEERFYVATAMQSNRNPAEAMFNVAKAIGWQPPQPAAAPPTADATPPRAPNGQFQPKAAPTPPRSLSHAAGAPGGQLTAEALLAMSDKEFEAATKDGGWARMMRGR